MTVENGQSIGIVSGLWDCLFRGVTFVFAFHGPLPDWMRILNERIPFRTHSLRPGKMRFCDRRSAMLLNSKRAQPAPRRGRE